MDYVDKMIATRRRNRRIVAMVDRIRTQNPDVSAKNRGLSVTARKFKLSRQRIEQIYKKANGASQVRQDRP